MQEQGPVVCCGELLIDLIASDGAYSLEQVGHFDVQPGGAPANVAVALARLGVASSFCGVVGDDPFGVRLRDGLRREGVETKGLRLAAGESTTIAFAWKDKAGDGHFRLLRMADQLLGTDDIGRADIEQAAALVVGSVALSAEPSRTAIRDAVERAEASGAPVCFDVNVRPTLWPDRASIVEACEPVMRRSFLLKLSLEDARALGYEAESPQEIVESLLGVGAANVVLTDGARGVWSGSLSGTERRMIDHLPAHRVESVDPTGAGDAFTAALISRLVRRGWSELHRDDFRFAAIAGALATTRRGAMTSLPTLGDIEQVLASSGGAESSGRSR